MDRPDAVRQLLGRRRGCARLARDHTPGDARPRAPDRLDAAPATAARPHQPLRDQRDPADGRHRDPGRRADLGQGELQGVLVHDGRARRRGPELRSAAATASLPTRRARGRSGHRLQSRPGGLARRRHAGKPAAKPLGTRPAYPGKRPPVVSSVPCYRSTPPNLNGPAANPGAAPRRSGRSHRTGPQASVVAPRQAGKGRASPRRSSAASTRSRPSGPPARAARRARRARPDRSTRPTGASREAGDPQARAGLHRDHRALPDRARRRRLHPRQPALHAARLGAARRQELLHAEGRVLHRAGGHAGPGPDREHRRRQGGGDLQGRARQRPRAGRDDEAREEVRHRLPGRLDAAAAQDGPQGHDRRALAGHADDGQAALGRDRPGAEHAAGHQPGRGAGGARRRHARLPQPPRERGRAGACATTAASSPP